MTMSSTHTAGTTAPEIQALFKAQYINLTTYRKDGTPVVTPVWGSEERGTIYIETSATAGKVKRIRREPHVTVSPCTARGVVTGQVVMAHARIVETAAEARIADGALQRKYGIKRQAFHMLIEGLRIIRRGPAMAQAQIAVTPFTEHDHDHDHNHDHHHDH